MRTYARQPITFVKGRECTLTDSTGKQYLDLLSGIAVNVLGYGHPKLASVCRKMAKSVWHTSNLFEIEGQIALAEKIAKNTLDGKTFFCNSGAEANEAALKLAVKRGKTIAPEKDEVISMINSFHGRTLGALNLTGQEKYRKDFPSLGNIRYVPFNDIKALEAAVNSRTAAVFLEVIQGEGGINPVTADYYSAVRALTKKHNALMIIDEVQTGVGRTGTMFGYQHQSEMPDVITAAKGLANGIPIGFMHAAPHAADVLTPGTHASTFGGNPFVTAVANTVFDIVSDKAFLKSVQDKGALFAKELSALSSSFSFIKEVRGRGLMIGVELSVSADNVKTKCLEQGLIVNSIHDSVIRLIPPLIISERDIERAISIFKTVFRSL